MQMKDVQSAFAESNSPKATVKNNVVESNFKNYF